MSTEKKTALVTGANRGIGYETAKELARWGFSVMLGARNERRGGDAARQATEESGGTVEFLGLDVSSRDGITGAESALRRRGVMLDLLINNAAITVDGFDRTVARKTLDTNFYGQVHVTDAMLPILRDGGSIVMVSSGAGELSQFAPALKERFLDPRLTRERLGELVESFVDAVASGRHAQEGWPTSCYAVSKAALNAFVRIAAKELEPRGIRVNAVCPGWVRSDMGGPSAPRSLAEGASSVLKTALMEVPDTGGFYRDGHRIEW